VLLQALKSYVLCCSHLGSGKGAAIPKGFDAQFPQFPLDSAVEATEMFPSNAVSILGSY